MAALSVSIPLSMVAALLTGPLERDMDAATLRRMREALSTNFAQHFMQTRHRDVFTLDGCVMPPKPILHASFAVRIRWSAWFKALSPSGRPILLTITDDRVKSRLEPLSASAAPLPFLLLPNQLCYTGNEERLASESSSPKEQAPSHMVPKQSPAPVAQMPLRPPTLHSPENSAQDVCAVALLDTEQTRRPRRKRGGVKHKQRGIHVDKARLDVTPYLHSGGVTGTLTGGVMLGRRAHPVGSS